MSNKKTIEGDCPPTNCSPIRSLEEFRNAGDAWLHTEWFINQSDDPEEREKAIAHQLTIERRMEEARPLFEFDDEGYPISLANAELTHPEPKPKDHE